MFFSYQPITTIRRKSFDVTICLKNYFYLLKYEMVLRIKEIISGLLELNINKDDVKRDVRMKNISTILIIFIISVSYVIIKTKSYT
jgi:hypothetical protein